MKDDKVKNSGTLEISNCGLIYVVVTGCFEIRNPPLEVFHEGLSGCLGKIVQQVTPQVFKSKKIAAFLFLLQGWKGVLH